MPPEPPFLRGRRVEEFFGQGHAVDAAAFGEPGPDAGGHIAAQDFSLFVNAVAVKDEDILHADDIALHAGDLGDGLQAAGAVGVPGQVDDDVQGRADQLAHGLFMQGQAGQGDHGLQAQQGIPGAVGVDGGHGAFVAGVHGLEHVHDLRPPDLAHDDAVGAHAQGVAHQVPLGDLALALDVGRPGFQAPHVLLLQLQFRGVLDGEDAFVVRDEAGEDVEQGGLARAGAAGDQDISLALTMAWKNLADVRGQGALGDQLLQGEAADGKAADGEHGAVQGQGRDDGVHPGAVGQAGVHHGGGLIDAAADVGDDLVDGVQQVGVVPEAHRGFFQLAAPLEVDLVIAVDQDIGDAGVVHEGLQRPQTQDFEFQLLDQAEALLLVEGGFFLVEQGGQGLADCLGDLVILQLVHVVQVQAFQEPEVHPVFHLIEAVFPAVVIPVIDRGLEKVHLFAGRRPPVVSFYYQNSTNPQVTSIKKRESAGAVSPPRRPPKCHNSWARSLRLRCSLQRGAASIKGTPWLMAAARGR